MMRSKNKSAFSLVEVTLSLGLVSFVLVALLGLFGVSLKASRSSADGTMVPQLTRVAMARVLGSTLPAPGTPVTYYYDATGGEATAGADDVVYTVEVDTRIPDDEDELEGLGGRMKVVVMKIAYPGGESTVCTSVVENP